MLWIAATLALAAAEPVAPASDAVPAPIEEHYRDHNLVSAFSTAAERRTLAAAHEAPADPRLARIARLMRRLEAQIEDVDRGIAPKFLPDVDRGMVRDLMPRPPETTFRSDLLRITSCRVDAEKGEAWVQLEVLALDSGSNVTLVGQYDMLTRGGLRPSVAELLAAARGRHLRTEEIHRWTRVDGQWRRAAATLTFVND